MELWYHPGLTSSATLTHRPGQKDNGRDCGREHSVVHFIGALPLDGTPSPPATQDSGPGPYHYHRPHAHGNSCRHVPEAGPATDTRHTQWVGRAAFVDYVGLDHSLLRQWWGIKKIFCLESVSPPDFHLFFSFSYLSSCWCMWYNNGHGRRK